jgi:hypothetical protein
MNRDNLLRILVVKINLIPYILSAVPYIYFCSIKIVLEYDYIMGVRVYGCTGIWVYMGVQVYKCMGVRVYRCMGVWVYGCVRYYSDAPR